LPVTKNLLSVKIHAEPKVRNRRFATGGSQSADPFDKAELFSVALGGKMRGLPIKQPAFMDKS
jgi:hypothetical protein